MIKKKLFLFLTIIATVLCIVGCTTEGQSSVRVYFRQSKFEVKYNHELVLEPVVKVSADLDKADVKLVYESLDESIVRYENGVVYPVAMGKAKVKVYYYYDPNIYSTAEITVLKADLPTIELEEVSVLKGDQHQIQYKLVDNFSDACATFSVDEANAELVEVSEEGLITAKQVGKATINVTVSDAEESYETSFEVVVVESDFTISYDLEGGTLPEGAITGYNALNLPIPLPTPTKVGYEFKGWELNGEVVKALPVGTYGDLKVKAVWEVCNYTISYDVEVEGNPGSYTVEDLPISLKPASKVGYEFKGWKFGEEEVKEITVESLGNYDLVAKFEIVNYTISYDVVVEGNPTTVTVEDEVVLLPASKAGYTFAGWYLNAEFTDSAVTEIKNLHENVKLFAKWYNGENTTIDTFTAEFIADWNKYGNDSVTAANFHNPTSGSIKVALANSEMLAKYKWLFEYALVSLASANQEHLEDAVYTDTVEVLEGLVSGDTAIISGSTHAWGRTLIRHWLHGLMNKELPNQNSTCKAYSVDFSKPENQASFLEVYKAYKATQTTPVEHDISYDVNGGVLPEGAATKFEEGKGLETLPTPTREGYKFLGWYEGETLVESISVERTTDVELVAKWEKEVVSEEFSISYDLDGGSWAAESISSYEEMAKAFVKAYEEYIRNYSTPYKDGELIPSEFMNVSYSYGNLDDFFDNPNYSQWAWIRTFVTEYCAKVGDQYQTNIADKNGEYHNTILRGNVHAFINQTKWDTWPKSADYTNVTFDDFKDKVPAGKVVEGPTSYKSDEGISLVNPVKEGFEFAGWILNGKVVTEIVAGTTGNLELKARWRATSSEQGVLLVGPEETYKTLDEAMAVAMPGDVIKVLAGTYVGGTISVNGVTVIGPNKGVNPVTTTRAEEAVFTGDIVVAADDVVIDGIKLTGKGRIVGHENGLANLTVTNVLISECSLNTASNNAANAPLCFLTVVKGAEYTNLVFTNILNIDTTEARGMIFYGGQINGLVIKDSKFVGKRSNYNDGIKIQSPTNTDGVTGLEYGIKGNVEIVGNHIENYAQYPIWFRHYLEGNYSIQNNTFVNNGQIAASHAAVSFITFAGTGAVKIDVLYNTVKASYMILRLDASAKLTDCVVHVNYNKLLECSATHYVKNANSSFSVDATNNWYEKTPTATVFSNATYSPYYEDEDKVPLYGQPLTFKGITYELNGGTLPKDAPQSFDSTTGLATLPTPTNGYKIFVGWKLNGEFVTSIAAGTESSVTLEAVWRENAIYVSKNGEAYAVATIAEALAKAKAGDKIIILAGEWEESFTVSIANLTIVGANQGVNPNTDERKAETILKGVITVTSAATNLKFDGLSFTGNAKIKNDDNSANIEGLVLTNSKVYDMNQVTAWSTTRYVCDAFLQLRVSNSAKNITVTNNLFENVGDINVLVNRVLNLSVDGNVFKNFGSDAIRIEGGVCGGLVYFTNNHFEQETAGHGNNAIFTVSIATSAAVTNVVVKGNKFVKVGETTSTNAPFNGTISSWYFQEYETHWLITDNIFDHCSNIMWLRNNGAKADTWTCKVENNQFLGLPLEYYFGTYRGTDTEKTNPHLAVFGENYYEDNDGNVITDLEAYKDKFKHLSTYGTASGAKTELGEGEKLEFWSITYELDGGSCKNLVTSYTSISDVIVLPTPTWNIYHEFVRWTLNGETITEIAKGTKGDLVIVAEWNEIEGNPVTLEFELNGGNWNYASFDDICLDLLKDYNAWGGTNYTQENLPTGAWENINIHTFFYSEGMKEKWSWLATWLGENGGGNNQKGCALLVTCDDAKSFDATNSNYKYAVSYEFRAIMRGSSITSNANYKTKDYSDGSLNETLLTALLSTVVSTLDTTEGKVLTLPSPKKPFLTFVGWYDNAEFSGEAVTTITVGATNPKYYAKFVDLNPVTNVNILNDVTTIAPFSSLQLEWEVLPAETANKAVKFISSDEKIATVSSTGLVEFLKAGSVTIKVVSLANGKVYGEKVVEVVAPDHFVAEYETNSYVTVDNEIKLSAKYVAGSTVKTVLWKSLTPELATVDAEGKVTGVKAGVATIRAYIDEETYLDIYVTVITKEVSDAIKLVLENHESNVFTKYDLPIGYPTKNEGYYKDVFGSVSNIFYNHELEIDESMLEAGNATGSYYKNSVKNEGLEFITVHYTGTFGTTADTDNIATNFTRSGTSVSIHYVTGNHGVDSSGNETAEVFHTLSHDHGAYHAGDSSARYHSNSTLKNANGDKIFTWMPTDVAYDGVDLLDVKFTASQDFYYEINGKKTTIKLPETWNYDSRNSTHIYNYETGLISSQDNFLSKFTWGSTFKDRTPESFFNSQDFPIKVIDGEYYMGPTWWCFDQVVEGRICGSGGNRNSIGIESCVNEGSDVWYTWQVTAQLVAKLMYDNNLGIERVKGHHFFSGKDCPQPLLLNNMEIWYKFIDMVQAEYQLITTYKDYEFTLSSESELLSANGRVVGTPEDATCVQYTVTVKVGDKTETITLASMVQSLYNKN